MSLTEQLDPGGNSGSEFESAHDLKSLEQAVPTNEADDPNYAFNATSEELLRDINLQLRHIEGFEALQKQYPDHDDFVDSIEHAKERLREAQDHLNRLN